MALSSSVRTCGWKLFDIIRPPIEHAVVDNYEPVQFDVQEIAPELKIYRCLSCNTGAKIDVSSVRLAVYLIFPLCLQTASLGGLT